MKAYQRIAAIVVVVALFFTAGCSGTTLTGADTTWVYKTDNETVSAGHYITAQLVELTSFINEIGQNYEFGEDEKQPTTFSEFLELEYEGETGAQRVERLSKRTAKTALAVSSEFARLGLSLPEYYADSIVDYASQAWENEKDYFEQNGVSRESYVAFNEDSLRREELFFALYETGGERAPAESTLAEAFLNDFALGDVVSIPLFDSTQADEREPADYERDMRALADDLLARSKAGESPEELQLEVLRATTPEEEQEDIQPIAEGNLSYIVSDYTIENYIQGGEGEMAQLIMDSKGQEPFLHEPEGAYMISLVIPQELTIEAPSFEFMEPYLLDHLMMDDYLEYLDGVASGLTIETNDKAVKRYTPDKIKEMPYTGSPQEEVTDELDLSELEIG